MESRKRYRLFTNTAFVVLVLYYCEGKSIVLIIVKAKCLQKLVTETSMAPRFPKAPILEDGPLPILPEPDFKIYGSEDKPLQTFFFHATAKTLDEQELPSFEDSNDSLNLSERESGASSESPGGRQVDASEKQLPGDLNGSQASDDINEVTEAPINPTKDPTYPTEAPNDAPTDAPKDDPTDASNDVPNESTARELPSLLQRTLMKEAYKEVFAKLMEAKLKAQMNQSMMANGPYGMRGNPQMNPMYQQINPFVYQQQRMAQQLAMKQALRSMRTDQQAGYGTKGSSLQMPYQQPYEMASGAYNEQDGMWGNQMTMNQYQNQQRIQQMMWRQEQANRMYGQGENSAHVRPSFQEPVQNRQSEDEETPPTTSSTKPPEENPAEATKEKIGKHKKEEREGPIEGQGDKGNEESRKESYKAAEEERKAHNEEPKKSRKREHRKAPMQPPREEPAEESRDEPPEESRDEGPNNNRPELPRFPAYNTGANTGVVLGLDERMNMTEDGGPEDEAEDEATAFENQAYTDKLREVIEPGDERAAPSLEDSEFLDTILQGLNTKQARKKPRRQKKPRFLVKANIRKLSREKLKKARWLWDTPPDYCMGRILIHDECLTNSLEKRWSFNFDDGLCYLYEEPCPEGKENSFTTLSQCISSCWRQIFDEDY